VSLSVEKVTRQQLLELLRKNNGIFNNGVTDVIVVNFDAKTDNIFGIGATLASEFAQDGKSITNLPLCTKSPLSASGLSLFSVLSFELLKTKQEAFCLSIDQYIKSVVDAVVAKTKKYLAVFTADKPYRSTVSRVCLLFFLSCVLLQTKI